MRSETENQKHTYWMETNRGQIRKIFMNEQLEHKKALSHLTNEAIKLVNVFNTYVTTLKHNIYFPFFFFLVKHPDQGNLYEDVFWLKVLERYLLPPRHKIMTAESSHLKTKQVAERANLWWCLTFETSKSVPILSSNIFSSTRSTLLKLPK